MSTRYREDERSRDRDVKENARDVKSREDAKAIISPRDSITERWCEGSYKPGR